MSEEDKDLERLIEARLLRVNALSFGIVTGLVGGLALFVATNWLVLKGGDHVGPHLSLLGQFFIGYRVTFVGSLVGFAYAFVSCLALGYAGARIYNWVAGLRERRGGPGEAGPGR